MISDALEVVGLGLLVWAAFLIAEPLGLVAAGAACLVVGLAIDGRRGGGDES